MPALSRLLLPTALLAGGLLASGGLHAATEDTRLWLQTTVDLPLGERTRLGLELQPRWREGGSRHDQTLLRPSLSWALGEGWSAALGYLHGELSQPAGDAIERRPWQQLSYAPPARAGWAGSARARLEQRALSGTEGTSHRLRLQLRATHTLPQAPAWQAVFANEVFLHLNDRPWAGPQGLAQNRLMLGLQWNAPPGLRVELGYLNQWVNQRDPRPSSVNHVLVLGLHQRF